MDEIPATLDRPMADSRSEYQLRINRVIDHIEANLPRPLPLEELARVAHFSPFHFHRVFRAMVGETPQRFIQRLRLEKAATDLQLRPHLSVTEVAPESGFSSPAAFARAFRAAFGVTASQWRAAGERKMNQPVRKMGQALRKTGQSPADAPGQGADMTESTIPLNVQVQTAPEQRVAYVRHTGPLSLIHISEPTRPY